MSSIDAQRFLQLQQDWQVQLRRTAHSESAEQAATVERWQQRYEQLAARTARLRSEGRWIRGHGDLLSVLSLDRAELTHSKVLAWLLDPGAAHGLGVGLLERLAEHLDLAGLTTEELGAANVRREVGHPDARADLLIEMPSTTIVIENKIDAVEQPDQCRRLVAAFGRVETSYLFLTLSGHAPTTAGTDLDTWNVCSYQQLADWLDEICANNTNASVRSYLQTLERVTR
jgi:hypothetical protein